VGGEETRREGERAERWRPYVLLGFAVFAVALSAWRPIPTGVWHDDGVYVMVGRALADGHGFTYQGVVDAPPAVKFPPVYSLFVALLWKLFGSIGVVTLVATLANLVFLASAAALLARGLRMAVGMPLWAALSAGGLAMVSADVLRTSSAVLSEPLFMVWAAAALAVWPAASTSERGEGARRARLVLAALLVLAIATRAAGLALVVGFAVAAATGRPGPRAAAWIVGPALATWGAWTAWAGRKGREIPVDMADLLGPYSGWIREQVSTDPVAFMARMPVHAAAVFERVAVLFLPRASGSLLWVAGLLVLGVAVFGVLRALRSFPPLAWSALAYAGLLLAWPYLDRRLVVPLHILLMGATAIGVVALMERAWSAPVRRAGATVLVAWAAYYGVVNAFRIAEEWPTAGYRIRAERMAAAVEAMRRTVAPDAVVGAPEFWAGLHLHGGWTVAPSVLFDPASTDVEAPSWGSPDAQERLWRMAGIEYLLLEQGGALNGAALDRIEGRCPGAVEVVARMPPMLLVRVHLDSGPHACPPAG